MIWSELTTPQGACLLVVVVLGLASIWAGSNSRHQWAIGLLTSAALLLRLFAATLDPFLNDWDEVYHAVVARNMAEHPMSPMLFREAALPITSSWAEQHFWLHKPPFFLWQMALCIKVFGAIPLAVRLPSVIWTVLMVPAVWRIGTLLRNERTGFVAAFLVAFSFLLQELVAGAINTDHNDAVFIAVITCATWAWMEHVRKPSVLLSVSVGLLSASAILTKWYIGGLLFLPFGLSLAYNGFKPADMRHYGIALIAAAIPVGFWIWHIAHWFPVESSYEAHENWLR
jgi:4-amino-4-deoxy-L-arabinose transferase